jgi:HEAT repeat protein
MRRLLLMTLAVLVAGCGARSTDHWLQQLKDADVVKRREAIRELGSRTSDSTRVVPALAEALRDDNPYVRHDSAAALGKFGADAEAAVPALTAALKDNDQNVRRAVEAALKKIVPSTAGRPGGRSS